jgi:hypothetical protein
VRASTHVRRAASKGRQCRFRRRLGSRAALVISIASLYLLGSGEPGTAESSRSDTDVVSVTVQAEPVAIAANSAEAWVVGSAAGKSEQGQLIRIAMSGAVRSRPVLGAPTDVTATKSSILVAIDRDGAVPDHDEVADFDPVGMQTGRRASTINPTRLAEADGYIWVLSAGRTDGSSLLQRLDLTANSRSELRLRGGGRYASLAVGGGRVWVLTETRIAGRTRSIVTPVDASANQTLNFSIVVPGVGQDIAYARRNAWVSTMRRAKGRVWGEIRRIVPARQTAVLTESLPTVRALTVRGIGLWVVSGRNQVDHRLSHRTSVGACDVRCRNDRRGRGRRHEHVDARPETTSDHSNPALSRSRVKTQSVRASSTSSFTSTGRTSATTRTAGWWIRRPASTSPVW